MEIADPEVDPGDVKLCGCHTPLDRSERTDMLKTTNLLHKQEALKRLGKSGGKVYNGPLRVTLFRSELPRLPFYICTQGGMGKY